MLYVRSSSEMQEERETCFVLQMQLQLQQQLPCCRCAVAVDVDVDLWARLGQTRLDISGRACLRNWVNVVECDVRQAFTLG